MAYLTGTLFVAMGVAVLITNWVPEDYGQLKIILAIVFFLYGAFRIISTFTKLKNSKRGEDIYE
jgi:hypothetical protein